MSTITATFDQDKFVADIMAAGESVKAPVEHAMALTFEICVRANFGMIGFERPNDWAPLSPSYARKVGRPYATLEETGMMKTQLRTEANAVKLSNDEVNYSLDHEYGMPFKGLPRRGVFPIQGGECMPRTYSLVVDAAQNELMRLLT